MPEILKHSRVRVTVEVLDSHDQRMGYPAVYRVWEPAIHGKMAGTDFGRRLARFIADLEAEVAALPAPGGDGKGEG